MEDKETFFLARKRLILNSYCNNNLIDFFLCLLGEKLDLIIELFFRFVSQTKGYDFMIEISLYVSQLKQASTILGVIVFF